jgi:hypothetical protein
MSCVLFFTKYAVDLVRLCSKMLLIAQLLFRKTHEFMHCWSMLSTIVRSSSMSTMREIEQSSAFKRDFKKYGEIANL